jgi:hypothetical protein
MAPHSHRILLLATLTSLLGACGDDPQGGRGLDGGSDGDAGQAGDGDALGDGDGDGDGDAADQERDGGPLVSDAGTQAPSDSLAALREACVDTINGYRATLKLPALKRASASEESCSDKGAKLDHDSGRAHGSSAAGALTCRAYSVPQNSCPDHAYSSSGDRLKVMKRCLQGMWDEGEPAEGIDKCVADYFDDKPACFLAHGHYINMVSKDSRSVSCGFHDTGKVMWMNQDFR